MSRRWRLALLGLCWAATPIALADLYRRRTRGMHGV